MAPIPHPPSDPAAMQDALAASGFIGLWSYEAWPDRLGLSAPLLDRLGIDPASAARGMPLNVLLARVHGGDRARVENMIHAALARGGTLEVAFRTGSGEGWLALRGRIEADGNAHRTWGRGIALDLTEHGPDAGGQHAVNRIAEHAIAMRSLVEALRRPGLTELLDRLMVEIGFELARHLHEASDVNRH